MTTRVREARRARDQDAHQGGPLDHAAVTSRSFVWTGERVDHGLRSCEERTDPPIVRVQVPADALGITAGGGGGASAGRGRGRASRRGRQWSSRR